MCLSCIENCLWFSHLESLLAVDTGARVWILVTEQTVVSIFHDSNSFTNLHAHDMSAVCYECRLVKRRCHLWRNLMRLQALNWLSVSRVVSYEDTLQNPTRVASIICFFNSYLCNFNIPKFNSCILFWKKWDRAAALLCLYYKFCWDVCRLCEGRWPDKSRKVGVNRYQCTASGD